MTNKNSINSSKIISPIDFAREMLKNTAEDGTLYLNEWCDDNNYKVNIEWTKENLEENINKNFCVYGKYALLGNEIYFNCEKISDSDGNYFSYEDFASPEMPQEYSESISFNEETIFIGGTEYFRGDCIKTNVILN